MVKILKDHSPVRLGPIDAVSNSIVLAYKANIRIIISVSNQPAGMAEAARRPKWRCLLRFSCLLFALAARDLLLCAKHLFVAAIDGRRRCGVDESRQITA